MNGLGSLDASGNQGGFTEGGLKTMLEALTTEVYNENFDGIAQSFLREFMDKHTLQIPLEEAKKNYEVYLTENKGKLDETNTGNYTKQYNCILQLLEILEKEPGDKERMISIFEQMQDYGMPPEGILRIPGMGMTDQAGEASGGFPRSCDGGFPDVTGIFGGFDPRSMGKEGEDCNIF